MLWLWQALMLEAFDLVFRAASQSLYVHESCRNSALLGSISCSRPSALVGGASWQSMLSTLKHHITEDTNLHLDLCVCDLMLSSCCLHQASPMRVFRPRQCGHQASPMFSKYSMLHLQG